MTPLQAEIEATTLKLGELIARQVAAELSDTLAQQAADIVMQKIQLPDFITKEEALQMLGIDASTLWRWEHENKIQRHGMIGNKVYYSRRNIEKYLTNQIH